MNWKFSTDSDWGEDDSSGIAVQPDHHENVNRPHKYRRKPKHESDVLCKTCEQNNLVNGSCPLCDWGDRNVSEPVRNHPIDPVKDERAGIRAAGIVRNSRHIPVPEDEPIDKRDFGPDDWCYVPDRKFTPIRFAVMWPAKNVAFYVDRDELDRMLAEDARNVAESEGQASFDFLNADVGPNEQMKMLTSWKGF